MRRKSIHILLLVFITGGFVLQSSTAIANRLPKYFFQGVVVPDSLNPDTTKVDLIYPFHDFTGNPYLDQQGQSPLFLNPPANIQREIIYNPETNSYEFQSKIGDFTYRPPTIMDFDDYQDYELKHDVNNYWKERAQTAGTAEGSRLIPKIYVGGEAFDRIFGSNTIDIRPQGSAEVSFGVLHTKRDDPALDVRQRRTTNFDFNMKIQMNVLAKIGDKIEFKANYNTESSFDFENTLKLKYEGNEDEIIQLIEAGNVSLPLRSTLISGSQSLFGVKTELQFGKTHVTAVFSQQQSETKNITVQGGAQTSRFKITALDYEANKHFFFTQYLRSHYESALSDLPVVTSDINITKIEVWVTNIGAATEENRSIVAFTDLGEGRQQWIHNPNIHPMQGGSIPSNYSNDMIRRMDTLRIRDINQVTSYLTGDPLGIGKINYMVAGEDFVKLENARKLKTTEYSINKKLGFISLNTTLSTDQVLAVAIQYTLIGSDSVYQVGEFSDQGITAPKCLVVKLLKSNNLNTKMPMWNLMMKNVYSIGAYQVQRDNFMFNILYSGNNQGVPTGYFTDGPDDVMGVPLIHLFGLDNLNSQLNPIPGGDGMFDYIDNATTMGGTIQASNGRIFFTKLEPFGRYVHDSIFPNNPDLAEKYAFDSLYTLTKAGAEQYPDKNKYILEGMYRSQSGADISLNALNVPQGSVKVTAGGVPLTENVDYTVDYTLGRVSIINEGIMNSGVPINVSLESNSMFNVQQKRMMGIHVDHEINKDFHIGGTLLNLHERPLTQKVNYGDDPISNTMWGLDLSYRTESRWLTKMVDKLPGISTKEISKISVDGEFAQFIPGHSKAIGNTGTSYIDDFEGAKSTIDLKNIINWTLASTPQGQPDMFPEAMMGGSTPESAYTYGKNRSKLAWYTIDPLFYDLRGGTKPKNVDKEELSRNSVRQVYETEVFPNKDNNRNNIPTNIAVLNLAHYPSERGPYNFDVSSNSYSAGIDENGNLHDPASRWSGMMRQIESTDFEASNIEYIEFWLMDPFTEDPDNTGELYINLGEVSEDI
ncbi:MAG: cell surface protein SprA, partial [Bacteroidales bacterium]